MQLTDYHAKYFAFDLTKRCSSDSLEKLAGAVAGAQVDLNPHQVDAALFAFNSPLSRGALLADEVGLGKTIEAGLVLSQKWAERKRRILIITPSNLRKQWYQEMAEKFFLPCAILEAKSYNAAIKTGNNLQFCSLVVNYDLPWNPQRIEQRIGRCHRYGQKHDVVVVNFLNRKNDADRRVFELLSEKLKLFDGVFGSSDEVLGAIESGVDFEKRIADIYQRCRKPQEIEVAFDQLQLELSFEINETMTQTRRKLLEHFDDEVREKLKVRDEDSRAALGRFEQLLMELTRHELKDHAEFTGDSAFRLGTAPFTAREPEIPLGLYELPRRSGEAITYRLNHPLAEAVIEQAKNRSLPDAEIHFDYAAHVGKVSLLEPLVGKCGELAVSYLSIQALDQAEDYLLFAAVTDDGQPVDGETARRLLSLPGTTSPPSQAEGEGGGGVSGSHHSALLETLTQQRQQEIQRSISERNARFFEVEVDKLEGWADDLKLGLEREIKELDRQIKEARRAATTALTLEDKLAGQKQIKTIESLRNQKRRSLFEAQDQVDKQREELIVQIEGKLQQRVSQAALFSIRWHLAQ